MQLIRQSDSLTVGGRVFNDLKNLIRLYGRVQANTFSGLYNTQTDAHYVVPAGKVLRIYAVRAIIYTAGAAGQRPKLGYGNAGINLSAIAGPAGATYLGQQIAMVFAGASATAAIEAALPGWPVPATKYPYIEMSAAGHDGEYLFFGYEEAA